MKANAKRIVFASAAATFLLGTAALVMLLNPRPRVPFAALEGAQVLGSSTTIYRRGSSPKTVYMVSPPIGFWSTGTEKKRGFHFISANPSSEDLVSKTCTFRVHKSLKELVGELQANQAKVSPSTSRLMVLEQPTDGKSLFVSTPAGERIQVNVDPAPDPEYTDVVVFEERDINLWDKAEAYLHGAYRNPPKQPMALIMPRPPAGLIRSAVKAKMK